MPQIPGNFARSHPVTYEHRFKREFNTSKIKKYTGHRRVAAVGSRTYCRQSGIASITIC